MLFIQIGRKISGAADKRPIWRLTTVGTIGSKTPVELVGYEDEEAGRSLRL